MKNRKLKWMASEIGQGGKKLTTNHPTWNWIPGHIQWKERTYYFNLFSDMPHPKQIYDKNIKNKTMKSHNYQVPKFDLKYFT